MATPQLGARDAWSNNREFWGRVRMAAISHARWQLDSANASNAAITNETKALARRVWTGQADTVAQHFAAILLTLPSIIDPGPTDPGQIDDAALDTGVQSIWVSYAGEAV